MDIIVTESILKSNAAHRGANNPWCSFAYTCPSKPIPNSVVSLIHPASNAHVTKKYMWSHSTFYTFSLAILAIRPLNIPEPNYLPASYFEYVGTQAVLNTSQNLASRHSCSASRIIFHWCMSGKKLKIAKQIPLYKKGGKSSFDNYRSISSISSISKVVRKWSVIRCIVIFQTTICLTQISMASGKPNWLKFM